MAPEARKDPPAYSSLPYVARAMTDASQQEVVNPAPMGLQEVPFQRAMLFVNAPSAVLKRPPATSWPENMVSALTRGSSALNDPARPAPSGRQVAPSHPPMRNIGVSP